MWHGTLDSGLINLDHVVRIVAEPEKGAPPAPGMLQRYRVEFHLANGDVLHTIEYGDFSGDLDIPTPVIPAPPGYLGLKTHVISRDGRPEVAVRERMPIIGWTRTPAGASGMLASTATPRCSTRSSFPTAASGAGSDTRKARLSGLRRSRNTPTTRLSSSGRAKVEAAADAMTV